MVRGADLRCLVIPVTLDLPVEGVNLQDHAIVPIAWEFKLGNTLFVNGGRHINGAPWSSNLPG